MINSYSFKIWPREAEGALQHRDSRMRGGRLPDELKARPAVFLVRDGASLSCGEFDAYCRTRLATYKAAKVEFGGAAETPPGKILKGCATCTGGA
jgi:hypothetical protein